MCTQKNVIRRGKEGRKENGLKKKTATETRQNPLD